MVMRAEKSKLIIESQIMHYTVTKRHICSKIYNIILRKSKMALLFGSLWYYIIKYLTTALASTSLKHFDMSTLHFHLVTCVQPLRPSFQ